MDPCAGKRVAENPKEKREDDQQQSGNKGWRSCLNIFRLKLCCSRYAGPVRANAWRRIPSERERERERMTQIKTDKQGEEVTPVLWQLAKAANAASAPAARFQGGRRRTMGLAGRSKRPIPRARPAARAVRAPTVNILELCSFPLLAIARAQGCHLIREAELKKSNGELLLPGQNLAETRARLAELIRERRRLLTQYRVWRSKGGGAEFVPPNSCRVTACANLHGRPRRSGMSSGYGKGRARRGPPCPCACAEAAACSGGTKCPLYRSAAKAARLARCRFAPCNALLKGFSGW